MMEDRVHLFCSANWNPRAQEPDPNQMLAPLRTTLNHLSNQRRSLTKLILLRGELTKDLDYCKLVLDCMTPSLAGTEIDIKVDDGSPARVATHISRAAEEAASSNAELWLDLTPGPKQRTAIMFAAGSAVPNVLILYSEATQGERYEVRSLPPLGSYNRWLGRHGIRIRNYRQELAGLARDADIAAHERDSPIARAVSHLLAHEVGLDSYAIDLSSQLVTLAERVSLKEVPENLFGVSKEQWQNDADRIIKSVERTDPAKRAAGRASQMLYQLRCLFGHDQDVSQQPQESDAVALLDSLAFLATRLKLPGPPQTRTTCLFENAMFVAVDGDDVGRSFEERLANCIDAKSAVALQQWSQMTQQSLIDDFLYLRDTWQGEMLARTGDGFLAAFPDAHFEAVKRSFRPRLGDATATTGFGRSAKDAYMALKLGKAKNRGGGLFFCFNPPTEEILWDTSHL